MGNEALGVVESTLCLISASVPTPSLVLFYLHRRNVSLAKTYPFPPGVWHFEGFSLPPFPDHLRCWQTPGRIWVVPGLSVLELRLD
jgi:hypothetical protein